MIRHLDHKNDSLEANKQRLQTDLAQKKKENDILQEKLLTADNQVITLVTYSEKLSGTIAEQKAAMEFLAKAAHEQAVSFREQLLAQRRKVLSFA